MREEIENLKWFFLISIANLALVFFLTPVLVYGSENGFDTVYLQSFNRITGIEYQSDAFITREDFCAAVSVIFGYEKSENTETPFVDADKIKPQNRGYIASLYEHGVLTGSADDSGIYMLPDSYITKQDALTVLGKILIKTSGGILNPEEFVGFSDADCVSPYAYEYAAWFAKQGILYVNEAGFINPRAAVISEELAELTMKSYDFVRYNSIMLQILSGTGDKGHTDGNLENAKFTQPYGVAYGFEDGLIVFDTYNNSVRSVSGAVTNTISGGTAVRDVYGFSKGYYLNDELNSSLFNRPTGGCINSNGDLLIADSGNNVIRVVNNGTEGVVGTFCGTNAGYKDGAPGEAQFDTPMAIAIDRMNNIYIADTLNNCIRKADEKGNVTTIAGRPGEEGYADGQALEALFYNPSGIAVDETGSVIYVADTGNHLIRKISGGTVQTIAGYINEYDEDANAVGGYADGAAEEAMFNLPMGIAIAEGYIVIADCGNNRIRCITPTGNVLTVAGQADPGDLVGGALDSKFNQPCGVGYYGGQLYIADTLNNKIKTMAFEPSLYQ